MEFYSTRSNSAINLYKTHGDEHHSHQNVKSFFNTLTNSADIAQWLHGISWTAVSAFCLVTTVILPLSPEFVAVIPARIHLRFAS
jgi:hypothetical protein